MTLELPTPGLVFWPVGCGDSTTISATADIVVQIDVHNVEAADGADDPRVPVVDALVALLPRRQGHPYLAAFGATHLDQDHIKGFAELLERVHIGDLWFTPRVLWEQEEEGLCDDAKAFRDEAERRIRSLKSRGQVDSGDRIRIIGYHEVLREHSEIYDGLPEASVTVPGSEFTSVDGCDLEGVFRAFVHAPFQADTEADRNSTSFALQITLSDGSGTGHALLLGDLAYPTLQRIFQTSEPADLQWNVLLAPHHCSKAAMYWQGPADSEPGLQRPLLNAIHEAGLRPTFVVSSSGPIPDVDEPGANPPHAKAAARYRDVADSFICTGEEPSALAPEPIAFRISASGFERQTTSGSGQSEKAGGGGLKAVTEAARGRPAPPTTITGFGRR